jgi:tetratricopeptide (TPR) repeat protein
MRRLLGSVALLWLLGSSLEAADPAKPWYVASTLDRQGKLSEALPLYQAQAEQTQTKADRLRYAGALLRAGKTAEGREVYSALMVEGGSLHHGGKPVGDNVPLCASSALLNGFPALAVEYMRPAFRSRPGDPAAGLLLARALLATGDVAGARDVVREVAKRTEELVVGQRIELARAYLLAGDVAWARRLLERDIPESVGQMMRDSILTNVAFKERDWPRVSSALADAKRKAPPALAEKRVDRSWRNVQRELRSMQLRRAIALWKQGKREDAVDEASAAQEADEEYVRSAAILLGAAAKLTEGHRDEAIARLKALGGHDARFAEPVARLQTALAKAGDGRQAIAGLQAPLSAEDRAYDFVTKPLFEILGDAAQPQKASRHADGAARYPGCQRTDTPVACRQRARPLLCRVACCIAPLHWPS